MTGLYNHGNFFTCVKCNFYGRMQDLRTIIHFQTDLVICVVFQIWFLCSHLRWKDSHRKSWPGEQQQYWIYIFMILIELISTKQKGLLALHPEYMSFSSIVNTWHTFSGLSLRILVAGVRCNITGEYFEKGSAPK